MASVEMCNNDGTRGDVGGDSNPTLTLIVYTRAMCERVSAS